MANQLYSQNNSKKIVLIIVVLLLHLLICGCNSKTEDDHVMVFGKYEQDNDLSNGKENLEWIILDEKEDSIFVITKYAIDAQPYDSEGRSVTWSDCSLRQWLNNDFMDEAFSPQEKSLIINTEIADENGENIVDQVFLISYEEAEKYFSTDKERSTSETKHLIKNVGIYYTPDWYLRSPTDATYRSTSFVEYSGKLSGNKNGNYMECGIRPAMWISKT